MLLARGMSRTSWHELAPLKSFPLPLVIPVALLVAGLHFLLSELDNLTRMVLPMPPAIAETFSSLFDVGQCWWASMLALVVVAPVTEEVLFRGLILRGFLQRYSARKSIWLSALFFGALHLNPWQLFYTTLLGVILGWLYLHTRSLGLCILVHALNNSAVFIAAGLDLNIPGYTVGGFSQQPEFQPWWLDLTGLGLCLLGFWLVRRILAQQGITPPPLPPRETTVAGLS
jgi:uncharacterized protein